jgi:FMN phosphatase YigB (HAD superfamily)
MSFFFFNNYSLPTNTYTPENTIIAFDLHKVLMEQNFFKITIKLLKRNPKAGFLFFSRRFTNDLRICIKEGLIVEKIFEKMGKQYRQIRTIKQDLIEILNAEPLFNDSMAIVLELKQLGYKVFLLSNIAQDTFEDLEKKRPDFVALFDGYYIPSVANNYIRKPNPAFYAKFKEYLIQSGCGDKKIIFVDDRERNIKAAGADVCGIIYRSANALRKTLRNLGVPLIRKPKKKFDFSNSSSRLLTDKDPRKTFF